MEGDEAPEDAGCTSLIFPQRAGEDGAQILDLKGGQLQLLVPWASR